MCRDHDTTSLQWDCQGERARHGWLRAGWAICWRQKSSAARGTLRAKAANLGCLLQLCPQHTAGTSTADWNHCTEVQVPPSQAPELHLIIISGSCQVEMCCDCWHSCPSSIYRHCVGEKWVFLARGCWPSWDLWFGAGWGVALWADRSCSLFSHAMPKALHLLCSYHA